MRNVQQILADRELAKQKVAFEAETTELLARIPEKYRAELLAQALQAAKKDLWRKHQILDEETALLKVALSILRESVSTFKEPVEPTEREKILA